ncbi:hypothetical protein [Collimonas sp. OK412]|jgi:hypothetical protein|uniref:hypothetical protein n=1 Tax=Collimonas sp. (strain OK412) TaxID=1801619 RepID=UPI0008EA247F|nr:hypothetical protein [Collimonas sp. OK412]SFC32941.1 hypothetical protein SAMN04515619_106224 [Collimonas sp. OK412]
MDAATKQKILKQCYSKRFDEKYSRKFQYQDKATDVRNYVKLTPADIIDLLDTASASARSQARLLLQLMQGRPWLPSATAHEGGIGDQRGVDNNLHITLKVGDKSYHLRCKEQPALHVIQITG